MGMDNLPPPFTFVRHRTPRRPQNPTHNPETDASKRASADTKNSRGRRIGKIFAPLLDKRLRRRHLFFRHMASTGQPAASLMINKPCLSKHASNGVGRDALQHLNVETRDGFRRKPGLAETHDRFLLV